MCFIYLLNLRGTVNFSKKRLLHVLNWSSYEECGTLFKENWTPYEINAKGIIRTIGEKKQTNLEEFLLQIHVWLPCFEHLQHFNAPYSFFSIFVPNSRLSTIFFNYSAFTVKAEFRMKRGFLQWTRVFLPPSLWMRSILK